MKKILFISFCLLPILGFGQKADSIVYGRLTMWSEGSSHYYTFEQGNSNGTSSYIEKKVPCANEIGVLSKLGSQGWHYLMTFPGNSNDVEYILEKIYKKD